MTRSIMALLNSTMIGQSVHLVRCFPSVVCNRMGVGTGEARVAMAFLAKYSDKIYVLAWKVKMNIPHASA